MPPNDIPSAPPMPMDGGNAQEGDMPEPPMEEDPKEDKSEIDSIFNKLDTEKQAAVIKYAKSMVNDTDDEEGPDGDGGIPEPPIIGSHFKKTEIMGLFDFLFFSSVMNKSSNRKSSSSSDSSNSRSSSYDAGYEEGYDDSCYDHGFHDDCDCHDTYDCGDYDDDCENDCN